MVTVKPSAHRLQQAGMAFTRRACLGGVMAMNFAVAQAAGAPRLVSLDWGLTETLLALDARPVGVAEVAAYDRDVATLPVPPGIADVGLRLDPDMELLQLLRPDAILINGSQSAQAAMLGQLA